MNIIIRCVSEWIYLVVIVQDCRITWLTKLAWLFWCGLGFGYFNLNFSRCIFVMDWLGIYCCNFCLLIDEHFSIGIYPISLEGKHFVSFFCFFRTLQFANHTPNWGVVVRRRELLLWLSLFLKIIFKLQIFWTSFCVIQYVVIFSQFSKVDFLTFYIWDQFWLILILIFI